MIVSFGDRMTEDLFRGKSTRHTRQFQTDIIACAARKLDMVHAAKALLDLRSPPGNRLEALQGDRVDCYSIRINNRWRIVFRWDDGNAHEVRVVDYHGG